MAADVRPSSRTSPSTCREDQVQQPQRHAGIMSDQRSPLVSDPGPTSGTPQAARSSGSSILTGQPEVWTRAARLNEGGPRLLDPRCVLEQREESHGPWLTVAMMRRVCWAWPGWRWSVSCSPRLGVRIVQLVTDDPDAARCPACRVVSTSGKDWVLTRPHDLPCGGGQVAVQWRKRRWRCRTEDCARQSFTEQVAQVPAGMRTTTRLRTALAVAVEDGRDQSEVAAAHGVSWPTVQRAVVVHGAVELVEPEPVRVLGMDETRFGRPRWLPDGHHDDGRIRWRAHGSVGDRVRRHHRRAGPVGAGRRPDQRRGAGLAGRPHARRSGPGSRWW